MARQTRLSAHQRSCELAIRIIYESLIYRYWLYREWHARLPVLGIIGLNPSTADEKLNDPTIRKEIGFVERWGYGAILKLNLYAYRATNPTELFKAMKRGENVVGGRRNHFDALGLYCRDFRVENILAAWGARGGDRGLRVARRIGKPLSCLARNKDGSPVHPLYIPYDRKTEPYNFTKESST